MLRVDKGSQPMLTLPLVSSSAALTSIIPRIASHPCQHGRHLSTGRLVEGEQLSRGGDVVTLQFLTNWAQVNILPPLC